VSRPTVRKNPGATSKERQKVLRVLRQRKRRNSKERRDGGRSEVGGVHQTLPERGGLTNGVNRVQILGGESEDHLWEKKEKVGCAALPSRFGVAGKGGPSPPTSRKKEKKKKKKGRKRGRRHGV